MARFLTVTMNPAVDIFATTAQVLPTHKLRCTDAQIHPGGGGINVARVLHRLGASALALYPAGGMTGNQLQQLLNHEQLPHRAMPITDETRTSFTAHESSSGQDFRFVLPGPRLTEPQWQACLTRVGAQQPAPGWLVASGSLPPGAPPDFHARLAKLARARGWRMVLDSSGPALAAALAQGVYLVKPSLRELRELTGLPLQTPSDWLAAARGLIQRGQTQVVALSLGESGAMLVTADTALTAASLRVQVASTIGAGDSFLAGLLWALDRDASPGEALRYGVAAGAAALLSAGTALSQAADVQQLYLQARAVPAA